MARDSLYGERIVWQGRPTVVTTPPLLRAVAALAFVSSAVSTLFAAVVATTLEHSPAPLLILAAWAATVGLGALHGPRIWLAQVKYTVTDRRVIWQRGPFKRSIERRSISFARIFWNGKTPGTGDVELVRAFQAGVFRRKLSLRLLGLSAPDRVWAIVRGTEDITPVGTGERPLAQRLDPGERVLWSARPRPRARAYLPGGTREVGELLLATLVTISIATMLWRAIPVFGRILDAGVSGRSGAFLAIVTGVALTALYLGVLAGYLVYDSMIRPARLVRDTRYLVTDQRVLIQRGREELHLDRSRIVDVIHAPAGDGLMNVFLVLDGPRARALAASGAFGEDRRSPSLRPVFQSVDDADSVTQILQAPDFRDAA